MAARRLELVAALSILLALHGCGGDSPSTSPQGAVESVTVTPAVDSIAARAQVTLSAAAVDVSGAPVSGTMTWTSSDSLVATVSGAGVVTAISAGRATITASQGGKSGNATLTVLPGTLSIKGVWAQFERLGGQGGFWNGELLKQWDSVDATAGVKVSDAVAQQMDVMRGIGINAISFQIVGTDSTSTGSSTPPACYIPPLGGARWPQPTALELTNLVKFFDLAQQKGIRILLELSHTHFEESPPDHATTWLTALINDVKAHPALELITFMGDVHVNNFGTPSCGLPAEPALWLGPSSTVYQHLKFEMSLARSLGVDPRKISAEAIVGDYATMANAASGLPQHAYNPIQTLKQLFDDQSWPAAQRTYALSFYERRKCEPSSAPPGCVDVPAAQWADSTMRFVSNTIGAASGSRAIAIEFGTYQDSASTPPATVSTLTTVMRRYGMDGGAYWIWVNTDNTYEASLPFADAVLRRGATIQFNAVKDSLQAAYVRP